MSAAIVRGAAVVAALVGALRPVQAQAPAQASASVRGVVRDSVTSGPLPQARVRLVELHREVATHEDGRFAFPALPAGRYTVTVTRPGFATSSRSLTVAPGEAAELTFPLQRSATQLAATVVTGTIDETSVDRTLSATTVLSGAALDRRMDATVSATLAGTPGFVATTLGPATARPVLRGLGGDRVLVLEDGLRPGDLSATSSDHATAIEPLGAKQIDVVRGPMSLLYGPSALGGVVNVVQEVIPTTMVDHAHGSLTVQGGTVQPGGSVAGVLTTDAKGLAWRFEGTVRQAGDLRTPEGIMGNTQLGTYGGAVGVSRVSDDGHLGASFRTYFSSYGLPGGFTGAHPDGVDLRMWRNSLRVEGERHRPRGPFTSMRGSAQYTFYAHQELGAPGSVTVAFLQNLAAFEGVARHAAWGPASSGAIGGRVQLRRIDVGGANRSTDTGDWSLAGFAVQEYGTGRLRAQGGVRYDLAQFVPLDPRRTVDVRGALIPVERRTFGAVSGSVGALLEVVDGVRVGTTVARAFRTPDFNELYSDGPHLAAYSYDVGNPQIRQETGLGAEAFLRVSRGALQAEASVFRNALTDFIFARNTGEIGRQGFAPKFQFVNTDAVFTGADGGFSYAPTRSLVFDGTFSYVRGERIGLSPLDSVPATTTPTDSFPAGAASRWLPWIPPLQGSLGARYDGRRWFGGATVRAAARQDRTGDYERPTDGWTTLDLQGGARFLVGSRLHAVTVRLDNAGNVLYRDHLARTKVVLPMAGRNLSVLYRVSF